MRSILNYLSEDVKTFLLRTAVPAGLVGAGTKLANTISGRDRYDVGASMAGTGMLSALLNSPTLLEPSKDEMKAKKKKKVEGKTK